MVIPPQLVPERLAFVEQHCSELVRAVEHASELLNMPSELFEHASELTEHAFKLFENASELSEHASELFVRLLEPSTLEARVCQKDLRSSSKKIQSLHLG